MSANFSENVVPLGDLKINPGKIGRITVTLYSLH